VLRRIITIVLIVLGVVVIGLALASATVWRPSDEVSASLTAAPEAPLLVTEPGVLELVADDVTIRATAEGDAPVTLAVGRDADVDGWVGEAPHVVVTGLTTWTELAADPVDGDGDSANPAGSDMWVAAASGTGEASLEWAGTEGRWRLLAATDGSAPAPRIELTWPQDVRTPFLVPGLVVGGLLLVGGLVLATLAMVRAREPEPAATGPDPSSQDRAAKPEEGK
jgi:hypothetical protein